MSKGQLPSIQLSSVEEFNRIIESSGTFLLMKHSLTCPVSQAAFDEFGKFTNNTKFPTYYLYVQDARPLSNYIAETFHIKHESPQALLFENGQVKWHVSHWNITETNIIQAIEKLK
ncbi:bacillithiol system redox-active protein YtxJ [Calidifontibacillus oryziterrae]|uniref:bacillithiol system redox-active protein YtxJ n=1 Tax=Calidifontibacillus oryziterrae TaxID=1191699 RepID=UPI00031F1CB7|nr:bacillithiol system redox-active protein YtxJ [Calidifontibacillus oryziterrae]